MRDVSLEALYRWDALPNGSRGANRDAEHAVYHDEYPSLTEEPDGRLMAVLDGLLATLHPNQRRAVELNIVAGLSYRETARLMGWYEGKSRRRANGRRAHREVRKGLRALRQAVGIGWVEAYVGDLLEGRG